MKKSTKYLTYAMIAFLAMSQCNTNVYAEETEIQETVLDIEKEQETQVEETNVEDEEVGDENFEEGSEETEETESEELFGFVVDEDGDTYYYYEDGHLLYGKQ